jgi:hypothetical protein
MFHGIQKFPPGIGQIRDFYKVDPEAKKRSIITICYECVGHCTKIYKNNRKHDYLVFDRIVMATIDKNSQYNIDGNCLRTI